ncbi:IS66 family transposase [Frankia sp. Ag45/Mut15]|uniref:IS66 family transposase n=1 Tax=Frankia umida TaxID=573489 RepID=A0ABT0K5R0_9ACTN|nr:IS66 family transposase [Frankia umida]MCK9879137.1 IS66 family transposase [Frankia umida]
MSGDPSAPSVPSYDELAALVVEQAALIAQLRAELEQARARIAELEAQVAKTSRNSSKPPSPDGLVKPAPKSLRTKTGRRPGGQNGHPGSTLRMVADPDVRVAHEPGPCGGCGTSLAGRPVTRTERRQVFDLPELRPQVTEHQLVERECGCGTRTKATAPAGVEAPVQYGPRVSAAAVYLYAGQFLSKDRTATALAELVGIPLSAGTVATMTARAATDLTGFLTAVRDLLAGAEVVGADETGLRVAGRLHWVHCARTGKYTLIDCHPKRGTAGIDALGVLTGFGGVVVHDAWAPYDTYTDATHQLCVAHVLRELQAVSDSAPAGAWCWATQAADALVALHRLAVDAATTGTPIDAADLVAHTRALRHAAHIGISRTSPRGTKLMAARHALACRLIDRETDYLRFTHDPRVPADNNGCERDIRMIKLRQKVSGCLRTLTGARQFCAIRSYLSTATKHGIPLFPALVQLAEGRPWMPATT